MCLRHDANLRPNINDIKFFIENLKLEQNFKKIFNEHNFETNNIHTNIINNGIFHTNSIKRPISYIKKSVHLNLDNYELPELDNSNSKKNLNLNNNNNDNNSQLKNLKIINEKKKRNLTPIKINYHYLIREKTPIKLNDKKTLNIINNGINNNKIINIKDNYNNNHIFKTDNNLIPKINNEKNSPEGRKKEYYIIKLKPPPYQKIQMIKKEKEQTNIIKEEKDKKGNIYNKEAFEQNHFVQKFNTIKNPLKQPDGKSPVNNSQSIPEVISNSDSLNSQNTDKFHKKINNLKDLDDYNNINGKNKNYHNNIKINYNNDNIIEEKIIKKENNFINNISLKTNNSKDKLLLLKPNGYFFQKKPLKNLSSLNIHKRRISSLITKSTLNNNSDNISKIFDNSNINNTLNKNLKNSKIKLKPITPGIRSITPFNDNIDKFDSKNVHNQLNYNISNKKYNNNSINDISNNIIDINSNIINNYNNDKTYFLREKRNIRQLNFNKNKLNNLSQIKTKFLNFIKPNYKNIEMINHKTEIK